MSGRRRRDPHAERDARRIGPSGRLRNTPPSAWPRPNPHAPASLAPGETGRLRRDPHARGSGPAVGQVPRKVVPAAPPKPAPIVVAKPTHLVLVVPDLAGGRLDAKDLGLIAAARRLADPGGAVAVAAFGGDASDLAAAGADRILPLAPLAESWLRLTALLSAFSALQPRFVLFGPSPTGGGDLARRLAARLGERPAVGVWRLCQERVMCRSPGIDLEGPAPRVMVLHESLLVVPAALPPREGRLLPVPQADPVCAVTTVAEERPDPQAVTLAEAELILSAGQGVTDWPAFHALAQALGAVVGGSRVVCDQGLLPRDRQVGASGTLVEPRCYLAMGISGATQHLEGITRCERVIAVNTDLHAQMIKRADLAVVADAQAVMPALLRLLAERRGG